MGCGVGAVEADGFAGVVDGGGCGGCEFIGEVSFEGCEHLVEKDPAFRSGAQRDARR